MVFLKLLLKLLENGVLTQEAIRFVNFNGLCYVNSFKQLFVHVFWPKIYLLCQFEQYWCASCEVIHTLTTMTETT